MTPDERLAMVVSTLESIGVSTLVMGGHAVRFYGLLRNTNDFDLHVAPDTWDDLGDRLRKCSAFAPFPVTEGPSWRTHAFKRFAIGKLPDGSDEWLEFWRENHLLDSFAKLQSRSRLGHYGGRSIAFLGLADLIRSKETERDRDWDDVSQLEAFLDRQLHAESGQGDDALVAALSRLRSRSGFGFHQLDGHFDRVALVARACQVAATPMTLAYLIPFIPEVDLPNMSPEIEPTIVDRLRKLSGGSPLHLALVEVVRRRYALQCKEIDRQDKLAIQARRPPK